MKGTQPARADDWFVLACSAADGSRSVALQLKESAPPTWQRYTDAWVAQANAGRHTYGRYSWNVMGSQPCPSPSPTPPPLSTFSFPPGVTPVRTPFIPTPTPTLNPGQSKKP